MRSTESVVSHNIKRASARVLPAIMVASIALLGCSSNSDSDHVLPLTDEQPAVGDFAKMSPAEQQRVLEATDYILGRDRNQRAQTLADSVANKIVKAYEQRKDGSFEFHNYSQNDDKLGAGSSGWGLLTFKPGHSQSPSSQSPEISVLVYKDGDGSFDLTKSVKSLTIDLNDGKTPWVSMEAPDYLTYVPFADVLPHMAWSLSLQPVPADNNGPLPPPTDEWISTQYEANRKSKAELQQIDNHIFATVNKSLQAFEFE